jgi:hypothetical protein
VVGGIRSGEEKLGRFCPIDEKQNKNCLLTRLSYQTSRPLDSSLRQYLSAFFKNFKNLYAGSCANKK